MPLLFHVPPTLPAGRIHAVRLTRAESRGLDCVAMIIHRATAKAMVSGKKPEHEAEATDRFAMLEGALACLIDDFHVVGLLPLRDRPRLF